MDTQTAHCPQEAWWAGVRVHSVDEWGPRRECEGGEGVQRKESISRFRVGNKPRPPTRFPSLVRTVWGRVGKARPRSALALPFPSRRARSIAPSPPERPAMAASGHAEPGGRVLTQVLDPLGPARRAGPAPRPAGHRPLPSAPPRPEGGAGAREGPLHAGRRRAAPRSGGARGGLRRRRARCV